MLRNYWSHVIVIFGEERKLSVTLLKEKYMILVCNGGNFQKLKRGYLIE